MANSYSIGRLFGIPIRVHVALVVFLALSALSNALAAGWQGMLYGLLYAIGLFASVVLHEIGHSLVARAKGARILEILLLPIGGMARLGAMPRRPVDEIQIALAGPAVSFALGVGGWWGLAPLAGAFNPYLQLAIAELSLTNFMLFLFNLIPSFPMDGGRVFRAVLTPRLGRFRATRIAAQVGRAFAWLFGFLAVWPLFRGGSPNLLLLLIAFFIHQAATAEARLAEHEAADARQRAPAGGTFQIPDADVQVGPPPYARPGPRAAAQGLFDDLLDKWR